MTSLALNSPPRLARGTSVRVGKPRPAAGRRTLPNVEQLETLQLLSTGNPVISGFVFVDENNNVTLTNNGLFDPGELPVGNAQVELLDTSGNVLATTKTDANGFYQFTTLNPNPAPVTATQTLTLNDPTQNNFTGQPLSPALNLFDPTLGTLTGVTVQRTVTQNGTVTTQNNNPNTAVQITAAANTTYEIDGLNQPISGSGMQVSAPMTSAAFDPANPTANVLTIAVNTNDAPPAQTFTDASSLAFFTATPGHTTITPTMTATSTGAASTDSGGNDLTTTFAGSTAAQVTVTYTYIPKVPIPAGNYVLEQAPLLPNLTDGKASENGTVFPNPGSPQKLPITVTNVDLPNNDFGKLTPGVPNNNNNGSNPTVGSVTRFGVHMQPTTLVVTFVGPVNVAAANNPNNYAIFNTQGAFIPVTSATFDAATNSVTLTPARRINVHYHFDLAVTLPGTGTPTTVFVPFGGKQSLGGFTDPHTGTFDTVQNGHIVSRVPLSSVSTTSVHAHSLHAAAHRGK
jgi:hypothetical protein